MATLADPLDLLEPDLDRGALRTAAAMVRRNRRVSFTPRRGLT